MSSPSVVPDHNDTLYFVMCDYGLAVGRAYVETDPDNSPSYRFRRIHQGGEGAGGERWSRHGLGRDSRNPG